MKFLMLSVLFAATFLEAGANPAAQKLARASRLGDVDVAKALLSANASPDLRDRYGLTPLYYAAQFNQAKMVELLLAYHADPNPQPEPPRSTGEAPATPLQYAAYLGNLRIASLLIGAGAAINAAGPSGRTALHYAVLASHLDIIQFLLENGAGVNNRDSEGASALDDAVWRGNLDAAAILLVHGASLNQTETKTGATPINEAAYMGKTQLVRYLLQFNPNLEIADKRGYSPLENAIRMGNQNSALLLLVAAPKPEPLNKMMQTAIARNESLVVEALIQHGVSANRALASGSTPLEEASLHGLVTIAALLLDHGAEIDHPDAASGTTALYAAASFGKTEVARLLLARGANPNLCGNSHKTPYQAALENGFMDAANLIRQHGGTKSCAAIAGS